MFWLSFKELNLKMYLCLTSTRYTQRVHAASGPVVTLQLVPLPSRAPFSPPVPPCRARQKRKRGRVDTPSVPPSSRSPLFAARPPARQRHDQYYAPELRHPNRSRDGLLLARSIFEAMVQLPFKTFSVCKTGN
jgi:hypothetical protein